MSTEVGWTLSLLACWWIAYQFGYSAGKEAGVDEIRALFMLSKLFTPTKKNQPPEPAGGGR